jgi:hypothetical protein
MMFIPHREHKTPLPVTGIAVLLLLLIIFCGEYKWWSPLVCRYGQVPSVTVHGRCRHRCGDGCNSLPHRRHPLVPPPPLLTPLVKSASLMVDTSGKFRGTANAQFYQNCSSHTEWQNDSPHPHPHPPCRRHFHNTRASSGQEEYLVSGYCLEK